MLVMDLSETESGVELRHRRGPAALQTLFFTAFITFVTVITIDVWPQIRDGRGSWLPPFDRLPTGGKMAVLYLSLGAGLAVCLFALGRAAYTLATGRVWHFDVQRKTVTRNGKRIAGFSEVREILIQGDFRGENDSLTLYTVVAGGKRMEVTSGDAGEDQFESFVFAARRIFERTSLPYRTVALRSQKPSAVLPAWWTKCEVCRRESE